MSGRPRRALRSTAGAALAAALALAATTLGATRAADPPAPMTNEDVVRLLGEGTSVADVLEAVRTRPAAFDVSEEMRAELRLAGVPDSVVAAMAARAAAAEPERPVDRPPRNTVHVTVTLGGAKTLKAPEWADEDAKARLHLPKEVDMRRVHDLAIFLACTTPVHAPDLWRTKTPLGRDTSGTPRHQMLTFVAGDTAEGQSPRLTVPQKIEADIDDLEPHDLVLGVAARIGDRWYTLSVSSPLKVDPGKLPPSISGRVEKGTGALAPKLTLAAVKP